MQDVQRLCSLATELLSLFSTAAVSASLKAEDPVMAVLLAAATAQGTSTPVASIRAAAVRHLSSELYAALPHALAAQAFTVGHILPVRKQSLHLLPSEPACFSRGGVNPGLVRSWRDGHIAAPDHGWHCLTSSLPLHGKPSTAQGPNRGIANP